MGNAHKILSWLLAVITSGSGQNNLSPNTAKAKLTSFAVETNIEFRYARTSVHLEAFNPSTNPQQFPFSLILPEAAFVMNMSLTYDGEEHVARVEEKNVAQKQFLDAVNAGRTAAQVKGTVRDAQKVSVDVNIDPGETVVLVVVYEELLKRKVGRYEYSANINPGSVVDNFTVTIHLNESLPIKDLLVPDISDNTNDIGSFEITGNGQADVENLGDSAALITYKPTRLDQESFGSEGIVSKFIVEYDVERDNQDSIVQVMDGYFVHFFAPNNQKPLPKHIIFVLDTSGSMQGVKMDQMKNAMVTILEEVTEKDYLSIISFSDETKVWRSGGQSTGSFAVQGVQQLKNEASRYILQLEANGGTNVNMALLEAIKVVENLKKNGGHGENTTPIIFFLTDGEATVGETNSKNILRNVVDTNIADEVKVPIFSLAFGSDADFNLLKDISLKNLGFAKKIYEGTGADIQLEGFYQTIAAPLLKNVKFEYVGDMWERSSLSDGNMPTFFLGTETIVVGKLNTVDARNHSKSGIIVAGEGINGNKYEDLIELGDISDVATESSVNFLERLWAFKTIKRLLAIAPLQTGISNTSKSKDPRKQALALSLRYNFVTELTSLIEIEAEVKPVPVSTNAGNNFRSVTTRSGNTPGSNNRITPFSAFNPRTAGNNFGSVDYDDFRSITPFSAFNPRTAGNNFGSVDYDDFFDYYANPVGDDDYAGDENLAKTVMTTTEGCGGFLCGNGASAAFFDDETSRVSGQTTHVVKVTKKRKRRCRTRYNLRQEGDCWKVCRKGRKRSFSQCGGFEVRSLRFTTTRATTTVATVTSCNITMFSHAYSNGDRVTFSEDQDILGSMDNKVWSLKIDGNCCWRIFTETNFRGKYKDFCTGIYNTATDIGFIFKDASSVKLIH